MKVDKWFQLFHTQRMMLNLVVLLQSKVHLDKQGFHVDLLALRNELDLQRSPECFVDAGKYPKTLRLPLSDEINQKAQNVMTQSMFEKKSTILGCLFM